ncbi:hypothetical protein N7478_008083 [Penicillium angulare]|uniref:uncharacterized protein n=1 Tax=Penicillium angulare TaxID=116970 RepID=UPI0025402126|nr:uncharacterized protein N7478_008083 [Penicillium angulare]KAJ5272958.1 hypothetical protein N7478_008083 [Penicillium angulare]
MPSFKNLLAVALSVTAATAAATCPTNWLSDTYNVTRCCYGNMLLEDTTAYCCVYDTNPDATASSTVTATASGDACFTKIPFTATNYSDLVSSASSKLVATATATSSDASSSTTSAATSGSSGSASVSGASSTSSAAAVPIATACEVIMGGAAIVAGLFVL